MDVAIQTALKRLLPIALLAAALFGSSGALACEKHLNSQQTNNSLQTSSSQQTNNTLENSRDPDTKATHK
jgi:hypothetical protein